MQRTQNLRGGGSNRGGMGSCPCEKKLGGNNGGGGVMHTEPGGGATGEGGGGMATKRSAACNTCESAVRVAYVYGASGEVV